MIGLSVQATGETTVSFAFDSLAADGSIDLQISPRPDFQFCVCPIYSIARAGAVTVPGLNQRATYYARARARTGVGIEDWSAVTGFRTSNGPARSVAPAAVMADAAMVVLPEPITGFADPYAETVAGFPIGNLMRDAPVAWRGRRGGNQHHVSFSVHGPVNTIALLNTNIPEAANVIIRGGASPDAVSPTSNAAYQSSPLSFRASPSLPGRPGYHGIYRLGAERTHRWWGITVLDCPLPADTIHIEHLIAGVDRVTKNAAAERTETPLPSTVVERRRSGMLDRVMGRPMRRVDFEIQFATEAQFETAYADLWRRENEAILVVPNAKSGSFLHDRILFGDLRGGRATNTTVPWYTRQFVIESII